MRRLLLAVAFIVVAGSFADAAVAVRAGKTFVSALGTSPTVAEPAGAASGDVLVAIAICDVAGAVTLPAGWTTPTGYRATQGVIAFAAGYVARGASAPNLTFGLTGSVNYEIHIVALSPGVNTVSFDSASAAGAVGAGVSHAPDPPATIAVKTTSMAVAGGVNFGGALAGGWGASTGYVIDNATAGNDGFLETKSLVASGSENPAAVTNFPTTGVPDWWDGFTMTFTDQTGAAALPQRSVIGVGTH